MGTYYDKLTAVAELDYADDTEKASYEQVVALIEACRDASNTYRKDPRFNGRTAAAALAWLDDFDSRLQAKADALDTAVTRYALARDAMETAKAKQSTLSEKLISPYEAQYVAAHGPYVDSKGAEITSEEYLSRLSASREARREEVSQKTLSTMNTAVAEQADLIREPYEPPKSPTAPGTAPKPSAAPKTSVRAPHVVKPPRVSPPDPGESYPPVVPGSPKGAPVKDYVPPPVTDRDDPRWRDDFVHAPGAGASSMFGGVIGVGGAGLAARAVAQMRAGSMPTGTTGAGSAATLGARGAAGSAATGSTAPRGGILANAANGSRGAGSGAAGAGTGARGSGAGGRGAGSRAAAAGAAGNRGKQDKKSKTEGIKLIGYRAERLDQDGANVEPPPGAAPGDSSQLAPLATSEDEGRW